MATRPMNEVVQRLRRTVLQPDGAGLTDGQLLSRYIELRDEDAFAALVRRHGPMVWGVCRRLLPTHHDAEDAFQVTFLVLVRKAATVVPREMVANWLYGVAHMTANRSRVAAAKTRRRERQVAEMPEPAVVEPDLWEDLRPLLDQELTRLPNQYRVVVVLCDLEGKTRKEAARQLGLPEGTVASRLARARAMLAKRLTQRGVTLSGGALAAVLTEKVASAGVPASLVSSTIKAASLVAAGQAAAGLVSVKVAALTEGVIKTMFVTKIKTASVTALLVLGFLGVGAGGWSYRTQAAGPAKAQAASEPKTDKTKLVEQPKADKLKSPAVRLRVGETKELVKNLEEIKEAKIDDPKVAAIKEWVATKDGLAVRIMATAPGRTILVIVPAKGKEERIEILVVNKADPPEQPKADKLDDCPLVANGKVLPGSITIVKRKNSGISWEGEIQRFTAQIQVATKNLQESKGDNSRRQALDQLLESVQAMKRLLDSPPFVPPPANKKPPEKDREEEAVRKIYPSVADLPGVQVITKEKWKAMKAILEPPPNPKADKKQDAQEKPAVKVYSSFDELVKSGSLPGVEVMSRETYQALVDALRKARAAQEKGKK